MKVRQISNFVPQQDERSSATVVNDAIVAEGEEYIVDTSETIRSKNILTGWKIATIRPRSGSISLAATTETAGINSTSITAPIAATGNNPISIVAPISPAREIPVNSSSLPNSQRATKASNTPQSAKWKLSKDFYSPTYKSRSKKYGRCQDSTV
jgi:hypothetical protein